MSCLVHRSATESSRINPNLLEVWNNYHHHPFYFSCLASTSFDCFGLSYEEQIKAVKWLGKLIKLLRINRKDYWQQIKWKENHPSHRFGAAIARLNHSLILASYTNTNRYRNGNSFIQKQRQRHRHPQQIDQLLIRFSYDDSCINPQQEIVFVFSLKPNDDKALKLLIRTIAYMFCNENRKTGQGAQTVQECYEWARNSTNQIQHLDSLPIDLRYAIVKDNPIIEIYNETMNSMFQEGIIHRDYYRWQSHGIVDFQKLKLSTMSTSTYPS